MVDCLLVELQDERARQAPMTWGQLGQQAIFDITGEESYRQNQVRSVDVPAEAPLEQVGAAIHTLLSRHESLRTLFTDDHRQRVLAQARLEVPVVTVGSAAEVAQFQSAFDRHTFQHDTQLPVRFGVTVAGDRGPATLHLVASHLAMDGFATDALAEEARRLCAQDPSCPPTSPATTSVGRYQPADRAAFECSEAGQDLSRRNIARWTRAQEAGALATPKPTRQGRTPRFWSATLVSATLRLSLQAACERLRSSPAVVLLAGLAEGLGRTFDLHTVPIRIATSNRTDVQDTGVETLMQWGLAVLDPTKPTDELVGAAFRETLRASASARYHTYDLFDALTGTRIPPDQSFLPQFFINYYEGGEPEAPSVSSDNPASVCTSEPSHEYDSDGLFFLFALPTRETITLYTIFDTALCAPMDAEHLLRTVERSVIRTARNEHR